MQEQASGGLGSLQNGAALPGIEPEPAAGRRRVATTTPIAASVTTLVRLHRRVSARAGAARAAAAMTAAAAVPTSLRVDERAGAAIGQELHEDSVRGLAVGITTPSTPRSMA